MLGSGLRRFRFLDFRNRSLASSPVTRTLEESGNRHFRITFPRTPPTKEVPCFSYNTPSLTSFHPWTDAPACKSQGAIFSQ